MVQERVGPTAPAGFADRDAVDSLMKRVCVIGAVIHLAFLILFVCTGIPALVPVNIASIVVYVVVFQLQRRSTTKPFVKFSLVGGEIIGHAVVATMIIGWDSGFYYYILLLVPVTAVGAIRPAWLKTAAVSAAGLGYLGVDISLRSATASHALTGTTLVVVYYFNLVATLIILAGLALRYRRFVNDTQAALRVMAATDPLTQLHNRESLTIVIQQQYSRAQRGHLLSFIMCDIDHFKAVNDRWGHAAGDAVLQTVSRSMTGSVRESDYLGRWGGEEFLVVLPDADADTAAVVAERLRSSVASLPAPFEDEPSRITVTVGVSTLEPGESATQSIARADAALYAGKRAGRNRVSIAAGAPGPQWHVAPST